MPRRRQVAANEATREAIKDTARRLMMEKGTVGLSLRAIARNLEMTAPALYHYYDSLDALITALIVDAFTHHAVHIRAVRDEAAQMGQSYGRQLFSAALAYRQWFIEHPIAFQLTYGNPIPGYVAPSEVTTPAARQIGEIFMESLMAGIEAGEFVITDSYQAIPPSIQTHYEAAQHLPKEIAKIFHVMNYVWSMMHGIVALEICNHLGPVVGDVAAFYEQAIYRLFKAIGLDLDEDTTSLSTL